MDLRCPECDSSMVLKQKENGDNYYGCSKDGCKSYLGCHPGTTDPLGTPAVARVRYLRIRCHRRFDRLWKEGHYTRDKAYKWLAAWFNLTEDQAHIGMFDEEKCLRLLVLLDDFYASRVPKKVMKKAKQRKWSAIIKRSRAEEEHYDCEE